MINRVQRWVKSASSPRVIGRSGEDVAADVPTDDPVEFAQLTEST